jgi:signal transduction histidine kinase
LYNKDFYSHRRLQKELKEELKLFTSKNQLNEINSIENLSVLILEAGLQNIYKDYSNILKSQNTGILEFFIEYNGLLLKANLFKFSSEKMFKTVTMIRSLLPDREEIVRDNLDLVSIIKESIEIYSNKIQAGIHLYLDFQEYPIVAGTSLEYKQVFTNIILNAIQAVENSVDKNIYIKTFLQKNDKIVVEVEDSGVGISKENQSKIFQPMFTTRQHAEGSGLGLYISQRNLNKYGYKLNFESNPGKTKFWIDI